jgi:hypothetical protein
VRFLVNVGWALEKVVEEGNDMELGEERRILASRKMSWTKVTAA